MPSCFLGGMSFILLRDYFPIARSEQSVHFSTEHPTPAESTRFKTAIGKLALLVEPAADQGAHSQLDQEVPSISYVLVALHTLHLARWHAKHYSLLSVMRFELLLPSDLPEWESQ